MRRCTSMGSPMNVVPTADAEGEVIERRIVPAISPASLESVLAAFRGPIEQMPPAPQVECIRITFDQALGQWVRLGQEEPVEVGARESHVGLLVHRECRRDVEQRELRHGAGVIEREPVRDARAAVVAAHRIALVAERAHQRGEVGGHRTLAVVGVQRLAARLVGVAVAAQVGQHQPEVWGQLPRHPLNHRSAPGRRHCQMPKERRQGLQDVKMSAHAERALPHSMNATVPPRSSIGNRVSARKQRCSLAYPATTAARAFSSAPVFCR